MTIITFKGGFELVLLDRLVGACRAVEAGAAAHPGAATGHAGGTRPAQMRHQRLLAGAHRQGSVGGSDPPCQGAAVFAPAGLLPHASLTLWVTNSILRHATAFHHRLQHSYYHNACLTHTVGHLQQSAHATASGTG